MFKLTEDQIQTLLSEDELGLVVRSHLYVEKKLDELIECMVYDAVYIDKINLSYVNKVYLACALGLDTDFKPMLVKLGKLRNDFSHDLSAKIDTELVDNMHSYLHPKARKSIPVVMGADYVNENSFNESHPKDKFIFLVLTLLVVLSGAIEEIKKVNV